MGLIGPWTRYYATETTQTVSSSVTYPTELPESDENYNKRGTTEIVSASVPVITSESYDSVYINLHSTNVFKTIHDPSVSSLDIQYRVYNNKDSASLNGGEEYIYLGEALTEWDFELSTSSHTRAYSFLKNQQGWESLTDDL